MYSIPMIILLAIILKVRGISGAKQSWEINENYDGKTYAVFGDMVLTPAQMLRYETADQLTIRGVSVKESTYNRWANNIVPILISPQYTASQKATLQASLKMFEQISCFKFVDRTTQRDYLFIVPLDGCYSYVGKIGGRQTVSLAADCIADYIIWHEMMHALGFEHEHQRPDRDTFIRVDYQNVQPGQLINFDKLQANLVDFPDDYDYKSIMHYDGFAFGKVDTTRRVRLATMTPIKAGVTLTDNMRFTQTDIAKLNRLGRCPANTQYSSQNSATSAVTQDCRDTATRISCEGNKRRGMCKNPFYRSIMIKSCQQTCGLCNYSRGIDEFVPPPTVTVPKCEDKSTKCAMYSQNGICTHPFYDNVRVKICAKTCGLC